jgi:hypothetical protein
MPAAAIAAAATATAAVVGSSAIKSGAKTAANAQTDAANANLQNAREYRDQMAGYINPLVPYAYAGANRIAQRLNLAPGAPQPANLFAPQPAANTNVANPFATGLGSGGPGWTPPAPSSNAPPGPAPAGKKWVHGPEGWALLDDTPSRFSNFREAVGGMGGGNPKDGRRVVDYLPDDAPGPDADIATRKAASRSDGGGLTAGFEYAPSGGGQPDFAAYGAANPDLQAEWERIVATGNAGNDKFKNDPNKYFAWHYDTYGRNEGRQVPTTAAASGPSSPPASTSGQALAAYANYPEGGLYGVPEPYAVSPSFASREEYSRPRGPELETFRRPDAIGAPSFSFDPKSWLNEAGVRFRIDEGNKAVNAASAVRGKLRSGDAAKALQERAQGIASEEYGNAFQRALQGYDRDFANYQYQQNRNDNLFSQDRSFGTNLWQYRTDRGDRNFDLDRAYSTSVYDADRAFSRGVFENDRGFAANRWDTETANLFGLSNIGTGAINAFGGVGSNYLNAANAANTTSANGTSNAAIAGAASTANLFAQAAQGITGIAGAYNNRNYNFGGGNGGFGSTAIVPGSGNPFSVPGVTPFNPPRF